MALLPTLPDTKKETLRRMFQKVDFQLGPDSTPTFAEVHATGAVTAYGGRDILRYAVMMAMITRRDH